MDERPLSGQEQAADVRQLLRALLVTLVSVATLLGSFLLARLDVAHEPTSTSQAIAGGSTATPFLPTLTVQPSPTISATPVGPTLPPTAEVIETTEATAEPTEGPTEVIEEDSSPTPTVSQPQVPAPASVCTIPPGWLIYTVRRGDTLTSLARRADTTTSVLVRGNCLGSTTLVAGSHLYVPPAFYASPTPEPYLCGPPLHWVIYIVRPGDTLYSLSRRFNVDLETLRRNNCLRSYAIDAGQALYVPPLPPTPWPSPTPWPTFTPSPTASPSMTPSPTASPTPVVPTATFTPAPNPTATPLPTSTPLPSTPSPIPTSTSTPSSTPSAASPSPTFTPMPSLTPTPSPPSPTSTPTWTPPPTQTSTTPPTATYTPTATPTLYARSSS